MLGAPRKLAGKGGINSHPDAADWGAAETTWRKRAGVPEPAPPAEVSDSPSLKDWWVLVWRVTFEGRRCASGVARWACVEYTGEHCSQRRWTRRTSSVLMLFPPPVYILYINTPLFLLFFFLLSDAETNYSELWPPFPFPWHTHTHTVGTFLHVPQIDWPGNTLLNHLRVWVSNSRAVGTEWGAVCTPHHVTCPDDRLPCSGVMLSSDLGCFHFWPWL